MKRKTKSGKLFIKIASASGTDVYESGNSIYLYQKPTSATIVSVFVFGFISVIFLINGILQMIVTEKSDKGMSVLAIILTVAGIASAAFTLVQIRKLVKTNSIPIENLKCICVFDFTKNILLDGQFNLLTTLTEVKLSHKFQAKSSSPALYLNWQNNRMMIVKGNPFAGGIIPIEKVLINRGINKA